ncbi:amidase [Cumulibacter manganitolerans]|uniref:amidase n=1 Tax=Cumulibacter manganitolerans TaxID=1884992 RepID=UPI0012974CC8|nr:amidase [Cumulibacter manganitolerans]
MTSNELWQWSAVDIANGVRDRSISAREAVTSAVERMRDVNPAINAVVIDTGDEALERARALDDDASDAAGGLLRGVPVTVKVNVDAAGYPNSNGVVALADNIATDDSPVVANLKKAGAVIIGITNTPEFSMRAVTDNPLYGRTINPWDPSITPGGSSGGAGASIAMGVGAVGHGNDIGGSLRWPAFCNGLSTIRPTQGRIPAFNPTALGTERPLLSTLMSTQGPLAREVRDVRLALHAMSARDPRDPFWVPAPLEGEPAPRKVAVAQIPDGLSPDPAVAAAVDDAAAMLRDAGYELSEVAVPNLPRALELWWTLIGTELREMSNMMELSSDVMQRILGSYFEITGPTSVRDYGLAAAERTGIIREWLLLLEEYPVILTPLSMRTHLSPDGDLGDAAHVEGVFRDFTFQTGLNVLGLPCVVTPTGLNEGRPIGVQLVAGRFREDTALAAASAIGDRVGRLTDQLWAR